MTKRTILLTMGFVGIVFPLRLSAVEIDCRVTAIQPGSVSVTTESQHLPNPGDPARVVIRIPDSDELAMVASGQVVQADNDLIVIRIVESPGKIVANQLVRISSEQPRARKPAPLIDDLPGTTTPGDHPGDNPVAPGSARRWTVSFENLNEGPQEGDALARFGISLLRAGEGKPAVSASTPAQVLPQGRTKLLAAGSASTRTSTLLLDFQAPLRRVELVRIGVVNGGSLPKWTMQGLDREGKVVDTTGENDWGFDAQSKRFSVTGHGIVSVRINVDNRWGDTTFATYSALPVAELSLEMDVPTGDHPPGDNPVEARKLLAFPQTHDGRSDIFLVQADGHVIKNLTSDASLSGGTYPSWSPDGTKIVFTSSDSQGGGLFIMDADGSNVSHLTYGSDVGATWSPDGNRIAFTHYNPGADNVTQIVVLDIKAAQPPGPAGSEAVGGKINLTDGSAYDADPAWSPDGTRIAFASNRSGGGFRLYVMNADGNNIRDLSQADNPQGHIYPAWSPDGKRIAYTDRGADELRHLFVIEADGRNKTLIAKSGQLDTFAAWSPDGKRIAFLSFDGTRGNLVTVDPDGNNRRVLSNEGAAYGGRPAWKPR